MKRSKILTALLVCAVFACLFGLAACGGGSSSSSASSSSASASTSSSSASSASASSSASSEASVSTSTSTSASSSASTMSVADLSEDEMRSAFTQIVAGMKEFYTGKSQAGEDVYYAGGADGSNALIAFADLSSGMMASYVGTVTVGDTNKLTITDEQSGGQISFTVSKNDDGAIVFDMGEGYGTVTLTKCSSNDVVNGLVEITKASAANSNAQTATQ